MLRSHDGDAGLTFEIDVATPSTVANERASLPSA